MPATFVPAQTAAQRPDQATEPTISVASISVHDEPQTPPRESITVEVQAPRPINRSSDQTTVQMPTGAQASLGEMTTRASVAPSDEENWATPAA